MGILIPRKIVFKLKCGLSSWLFTGPVHLASKVVLLTPVHSIYQLDITFDNTFWTLNAVLHIYKLLPMKYAHGFVVICILVVILQNLLNSCLTFIGINHGYLRCDMAFIEPMQHNKSNIYYLFQGYFTGSVAVVRFLPQCQLSYHEVYG